MSKYSRSTAMFCLTACAVTISVATGLGADQKTAGIGGSAAGYTTADIQIKNITLEMSLKPFRTMDEDSIVSTCRKLFRQWWPLTRQTDRSWGWRRPVAAARMAWNLARSETW